MGEGGALGEEAIARMNGLGACLETGCDNLVDCEIGLGRSGRTYRDRLVGHLDMQRILVGFRIDGDGSDAHAARRPDDATGDLAAVGDQDFVEHRAPTRKAPGLPSTAVSRGTTEAGKQPQTVRYSPTRGRGRFHSQTSTCRHAFSSLARVK